MKFNWKLVIAVAAIAAAPALAATVSEDFESYAPGTLDGASGPGGISWSKTSLAGSADAYAALPGYNSLKSGRWDVKDIGTVSEGDDMIGSFLGIGPQVTLTAWTYSFLSVDPLFTGKRDAEFRLLDGVVNSVGIGLVWRADGKLGDTNGNVSAINFVNQQWKQIQIDIDYAAGTYATYYDGNLITAGALGGVSATGLANTLNIFLETKDLNDVPNPNDSFLVDDIMITPEPASLVLLGLAGLLLRRR